MARSYCDIAYITADGKELHDVTSLEITRARSNAEAVSTMSRRRRPLGYKKGNVATELTIESRVRSPREFNWYEWLRTGEEFLIVYEEADGGARWHLVDCLVTEVATTHGEDGESTDRVRLLALDQKPE